MNIAQTDSAAVKLTGAEQNWRLAALSYGNASLVECMGVIWLTPN